MYQVKEFCNQYNVEADINKWLKENTAIKIIDIKYCANENSSNVLIIYMEGVNA